VSYAQSADKLAAAPKVAEIGATLAANPTGVKLLAGEAVVDSLGIDSLSDIVKNMQALTEAGTKCFISRDTEGNTATYIIENGAILRKTPKDKEVKDNFYRALTLLGIQGKQETVDAETREYIYVTDKNVAFINSVLAVLSNNNQEWVVRAVKERLRDSETKGLGEEVTVIASGNEAISSDAVSSTTAQPAPATELSASRPSNDRGFSTVGALVMTAILSGVGLVVYAFKSQIWTWIITEGIKHYFGYGLISAGILVSLYFLAWRYVFPVSWYMRRLNSYNLEVRKDVVDILGSIGDKKAIKPILELLGSLRQRLEVLDTKQQSGDTYYEEIVGVEPEYIEVSGSIEDAGDPHESLGTYNAPTKSVPNPDSGKPIVKRRFIKDVITEVEEEIGLIEKVLRKLGVNITVYSLDRELVRYVLENKKIPLEKLPQALRDFLQFLKDNGLSDMVVMGGAVRDIFYGIEPSDFDVALKVQVEQQERTAIDRSANFIPRRVYDVSMIELKRLADVMGVDVKNLQPPLESDSARFRGKDVQYAGPIEITVQNGKKILIRGFVVDSVTGKSLFPDSSIASLLQMGIDVDGNLYGYTESLENLLRSEIKIIGNRNIFKIGGILRTLRLKHQFGLKLSDEDYDFIKNSVTKARDNLINITFKEFFVRAMEKQYRKVIDTAMDRKSAEKEMRDLGITAYIKALRKKLDKQVNEPTSQPAKPATEASAGRPSNDRGFSTVGALVMTAILSGVGLVVYAFRNGIATWILSRSIGGYVFYGLIGAGLLVALYFIAWKAIFPESWFLYKLDAIYKISKEEDLILLKSKLSLLGLELKANTVGIPESRKHKIVLQYIEYEEKYQVTVSTYGPSMESGCGGVFNRYGNSYYVDSIEQIPSDQGEEGSGMGWIRVSYDKVSIPKVVKEETYYIIPAVNQPTNRSTDQKGFSTVGALVMTAVLSGVGLVVYAFKVSLVELFISFSPVLYIAGGVILGLLLLNKLMPRRLAMFSIISILLACVGCGTGNYQNNTGTDAGVDVTDAGTDVGLDVTDTGTDAVVDVTDAGTDAVVDVTDAGTDVGVDTPKLDLQEWKVDKYDEYFVNAQYKGFIVENDYFYCVGEHGVDIWRKNGDGLNLISRLPLMGYASYAKMHKSGNFVFVANGKYGLYVIDVSNPNSPVIKSNYNPNEDTIFLQGEYPFEIQDVKVSGNYLYVRILQPNPDYKQKIVQLKMNDSFDFESVSETELSDNNIEWYDIQGNYLFVLVDTGNYSSTGEYEYTLKAFDVNAPNGLQNPIVIKKLPGLEQASVVYSSSIGLWNNLLVVPHWDWADNDNRKISIYDLSDINNVSLVSSGVITGHFDPKGLIFYKDYLLENNDGESVDVYQMVNGVLNYLGHINGIQDPDLGQYWDGLVVYVEGDFLYVTDTDFHNGNTGKIKKFNLAGNDILNPSLVWSSVFEGEAVSSFFRISDKLFVLVSNVNGDEDQAGQIKIVQFEDDLEPVVLSSIPLTYTSGSPIAVYQGTYIYTNGCDAQPGKIYDISNSGQPQEVGGIWATSGNWTYSIVTYGHYMFTANGYDGLGIFDLSDPLHPVSVKTIKGLGDLSDLAIVGDFLIGDDQYVFSLADPENPVRLIDWPSDLVRVLELSFIEDDIMYSPVGIYDISNINEPVKIGEYTEPLPKEFYGYKVTKKGNYLYLSGLDGVFVVDVSDMTSPEIVSHLETPGIAENVFPFATNDAMLVQDSEGLIVVTPQFKPNPAPYTQLPTGKEQQIARMGIDHDGKLSATEATADFALLDKDSGAQAWTKLAEILGVSANDVVPEVQKRLQSILDELKKNPDYGTGIFGAVREVVLVDNLGGLDSDPIRADVPIGTTSNGAGVAVIQNGVIAIDIDAFRNEIVLRDVLKHELWHSVLELVESNPAIAEVTAIYQNLLDFSEMTEAEQNALIAFLGQADNGLQSQNYAGVLQEIKDNPIRTDVPTGVGTTSNGASRDALIHLAISYVMAEKRYAHLVEPLTSVLSPEGRGSDFEAVKKASEKLGLAVDVYAEIAKATNAVKPIVDKVKTADVSAKAIMKVKMLVSSMPVRETGFIEALLEKNKYMRLYVEDLEGNSHIIQWLQRVLEGKEKSPFQFYSREGHDIAQFLKDNNLKQAEVPEGIQRENIIDAREIMFAFNKGLSKDSLSLPIVYSVSGIYLAGQVVLADGNIAQLKDKDPLAYSTLMAMYKALFGNDFTEDMLTQMIFGVLPKIVPMTESIEAMRKAIAQIETMA
jgi:hypothetical protein